MKTRRVRYSVAVSLDGFIAGPDGEYDWIVMDPSVDFEAVFKQFDTLLMGRRTFELAQKVMGATMPGMQTIVCSRTLRPDQFRHGCIAREASATVAELKAKPGKDIWLFGGGVLFRSILDAGLVDTIELSVMPILLSQGMGLLAAGKRSPSLRLIKSKTTSSGILRLSYHIDYGAAVPAP